MGEVSMTRWCIEVFAYPGRDSPIPLPATRSRYIVGGSRDGFISVSFQRTAPGDKMERSVSSIIGKEGDRGGGGEINPILRRRLG